jgi:hypothetical protein
MMGMIPQPLMVPAVMVVSQPHKSKAQPDHQGDQQSNEHNYKGRIDVFEIHPLRFALKVMVRIGLVTEANPDSRETKTDERSGRDNGPTKCSHRELL